MLPRLPMSCIMHGGANPHEPCGPMCIGAGTEECSNRSCPGGTNGSSSGGMSHVACPTPQNPGQLFDPGGAFRGLGCRVLGV